jgi:RNA polymerase sigma-70 factor (ECF subfamily)
MELSDQTLIAKCLAGEDEFLERFVRKFSDPVYLTVQYTLRSKNAAFSRSDVEDLHNTVFVNLFDKKCKKLAQFQGNNGCSLLTWIRLIAARTVIDFLRRKGRDAICCQQTNISIDALSDFCAGASNQFDLLEQRDQVRILKDSMEKLKPREQLLLRLHTFRDLSIRQTARLMGITETNAYAIKHRAIKRLRERMKMYKN